jgi:tetratricopeptide (TPR) repeat protein
VLLYDRVFLFGSLRQVFAERGRLYLGLASGWLLLGVLLWNAPRNLSAGFTAHDANVWTYLLNQAVMITRYLWLALWPRELVLYYGWPLPLTLGAVLPQALLVAALLLLTGLALWRYPRAGFAGAWFFLTLAPTSSFVPIATEVGAERRMYLALIPLIALAVMGWRRVVTPAWWRAAALVVIAALLGAGTVFRTTEYQSSLRLAETTFERWPTPGAQSMLGTELAAAGRFAEAERHLREAAGGHPPARYYLATVLAAQNQRPEAIEQFKSFIESQPAALDQVHLARALLAEALTTEGRLDEAAAEYRAMLASNPDDGQAASLLAAILLRQQRFDEAIPLFRTAIEAQPADAPTLVGLGIALASTGRLDEAIAAFQAAVDLDPQNVHAQRNLARALAMRK